MVYLPAQQTAKFQSFSAPLLNIYDSHISAPIFGPNAWIAGVQPVSGGGIPASLPAIQMKLTFKEGGVFDYHTNFERIKERHQQVVEVSRESNAGSTVDLSSVHLEQLPAYESGHPDANMTASSLHHQQNTTTTTTNVPSSETEPIDPPPGYEEVQQQSVASELETQLRTSRAGSQEE